MGNTLSSFPCLNIIDHRNPNASQAKLIFWEGTTRLISGKQVAGEIMFDHPDLMLYRADSFYVGRPVPSLDIDEPLLRGRTYLALPVDCFGPCAVLSASSLASLGSGSHKRSPPLKFGDGSGTFEYVNGDDGKSLIRVCPEFIARLICKGKGVDPCFDDVSSGRRSMMNPGSVCSTPELRKCYEDLVGSREHVWSPKLETIRENDKRRVMLSPCRFISFEWKQHDKEA